MLNKELLADWICKSGKRKEHLAERLGLSRQGFYLKCIGKTEFTASEINILCDELSISKLTDKEHIFFAS